MQNILKIITLILFCQVSAVLAGEPILCNAPNKQFLPAVVSDGTGGAVCVWVDGRNLQDYDIYIQRVDANAKIMWQENGVPVCKDHYNQQNVSLVKCVEGFMIFWLDNRGGKGWDVYAQFVDAGGKILWQKNGIPICTSLGGQEALEAISDGLGGAIVVWEDHRSENMDIYVQRIDREGKFLWDKNGLPLSDPTGDQYDPVLVSDGNGGAIIVWWDITNPEWKIMAQHVSADGGLLWDTPLVVSPKSGIQGEPRIVSDDDGGAIVVWQNYENYVSNDVFAQRIDADGKKLWNVDGVPICEAPRIQKHPAVASDGNGGAVVVWCDSRDVFSDLYVQYIDAEGKICWERDGMMLCTAPGIQDAPFILCDNSGKIFVFWNDYREDYGNELMKDLYAQKIDLHGNILWQADGAKICNLKNSQTSPIATSDGTEGAFTVWSDAREDAGDIYFQRIGSDSVFLLEDYLERK